MIQTRWNRERNTRTLTCFYSVDLIPRTITDIRHLIADIDPLTIMMMTLPFTFEETHGHPIILVDVRASGGPGPGGIRDQVECNHHLPTLHALHQQAH